MYNRTDFNTRESFTEFYGIYANAPLQLHGRLLTNIWIFEPVIQKFLGHLEYVKLSENVVLLSSHFFVPKQNTKRHLMGFSGYLKKQIEI